jgi:cell division protein ZipA
MEDNLRNVLIILSAIAITAIFIHGLWTIRKQKNPYKLTASKDKLDPIKRDFDGKGFDQDGVGQVKVKKNNESIEKTNHTVSVSEQTVVSGVDLPDALSKSQLLIKKEVLGGLNPDNLQNHNVTEPQALDSSIDNDWLKETIEQDENQGKLNQKTHLDDASSSTLMTDMDTSITNNSSCSGIKTPKQSQPLYKQPVTRAKPSPTVLTQHNHKISTAGLKRNQLEIDFTNQQATHNDDNQINLSSIEDNKNSRKKIVEIEPQVIVLSVVMPANQQMLGAALLPTLLTLGLKYGEMNIFHRHQDNAGQGKVTFSLANIMNPGSFDLDTIETFATRGVSLFMTLPNTSDPFNVFEQMLNAAKQLAQEFNAQVLDDKRNILTKQIEQHYINNIREFEGISRMTSSR